MEYFEALTDLVEIDEDELVLIPMASPEGVPRELTEANRLSQPGLATRAGIAQSAIFAVLSGKRLLTSGHVQMVAKLFGVSPAVLAPA